MDLSTLKTTRSQLAKGGYIRNQFIFKNKFVKENKKVLETPKTFVPFKPVTLDYEDVYNGTKSFSNGYNPDTLRTPREQLLQNKRTPVRPSTFKSLDKIHKNSKLNREK
jgi:hypothetical protein